MESWFCESCYYIWLYFWIKTSYVGYSVRLSFNSSVGSDKRIGESLGAFSQQFEAPPELNDLFRSKRIEDIDPIKRQWQDVRLPTQVVLLTVKDEEFVACYACLKNVTKSYHVDLSWVYFGELGENREKVSCTMILASLKFNNYNFI